MNVKCTRQEPSKLHRGMSRCQHRPRCRSVLLQLTITMACTCSLQACLTAAHPVWQVVAVAPCLPLTNNTGVVTGASCSTPTLLQATTGHLGSLAVHRVSMTPVVATLSLQLCCSRPLATLRHIYMAICNVVHHGLPGPPVSLGVTCLQGPWLPSQQCQKSCMVAGASRANPVGPPWAAGGR